MNRLQLLDVELKAAISVDGDDLWARVCDGYGDGHRNGVAHRAQPGGVIQALRVQCRASEEVNLDAGAGVADDEAVAGTHLGAKNLGQVKDGYEPFRITMLVGNDWVASLPVGTSS